ncbi:MAG: hypothetical protein BMS9Abin17_1273 [Acidimicrobiia bacterium]|nr:MAG: hypothetical protein BMS9Abin17_1273 [Acidimicrobiia bacterium]
MWVLATALALVAAACAGTANDDSGGNATTSTASPTSSQSTTDEGSSTSSVPSQGNSSNLTFSVAEGWKAVSLGPGVKPAIAIDPSGAVGVTWLLEKIGEGFVAYATSGADWDVETIREGYFYGPIGLAYEPDGTPNIIIHDHQADDFDPQLGDLVRLFRDGSTWVEDIASDPGHDGWDSTVVIGDDGVIHAAGVDPAQFGSTDGVEYYRNAGTGWEVTRVGSGPIPYQYNVALALDPTGSPSLTYYNDADKDLIFAQLGGGSWNLETAAEEGDVGKYSSLAFGPDGQPAVTFFRQTGATSGEIVYATRGDGGWTQETIGQLDAFSELNARRNSSLAFDSQGRPNVAFSDTEGAWYAVRGDSGWEIQQILEADLPLGQLISLALSEDDTPNIALYEVTQQQPLDGSVAYLTTG